MRSTVFNYRDSTLPKDLTIEWLFKSKPIECSADGIENAKYSFEHDFAEGNLTLLIHNLKTSEQGTYSLRVKRLEKILIECSAHLIVIGGKNL